MRAAGHGREADLALFTDLYELTMLQAYFAERMEERACFSLFVRALPARRNYLLACGLDAVLAYLERLRFSAEDLEYIAGLAPFSEAFLRWLEDFHFTGDVYAVPEGTPLFAQEPILEVEAPIAQAQLIETCLLNQVHLETVIASKVARLVEAARGRPIVDFGSRRSYGIDAACKAARAGYIAGMQATSNVLAGRLYAIPLAGTMAHSYVQAHEEQRQAFRAFAELYETTVLLVDTYDTLEGVRDVVALADELGARFRISGIRLDSGDRAELARAARHVLDEAGLQRVKIFVSGGLDEYVITELLAAQAPIDGFGVGTELAVPSDAPAFDIAYKLTAYAGVGRMKLSPGKHTLPGRKQVYRLTEGGGSVGDVIALANEEHRGRPLLRQAMRGGVRVPDVERGLARVRTFARQELAALPADVRGIETPASPYPVQLSGGLERHVGEVRRALVAQRRRGSLA